MTTLETLLVANGDRKSIIVEGITFYFPADIPYKVLSDALEHTGPYDARETFAKLVCSMAEDEAGTKLFQPSEWQTLLNRGKSSIAPLFTLVGDLYIRLDDKVDEKVKELEGNQLGEPQSVSLTSSDDSPENWQPSSR